MAWTATVIASTKDKGILTATVQYTDGTTTFTDPPFRFGASQYPQALKGHVTDRLRHLTLADSTTVELGPITPNPEPSAPVPAVELWLTQFRKLEIAWMLIEAGVFQASQPQFQALVLKLRNNMTQEIWDALGAE